MTAPTFLLLFSLSHQRKESLQVPYMHGLDRKFQGRALQMEGGVERKSGCRGDQSRKEKNSLGGISELQDRKGLSVYHYWGTRCHLIVVGNGRLIAFIGSWQWVALTEKWSAQQILRQIRIPELLSGS